jgi:DNA-binding winged helix-turn-helix (wHTH) protein/tetratricopeptide (TPR) repeat protein
MLKLADMAARPDMQLGTLRVSPSRRIVSGPAGEANLEPRIMQVLLLLLDSEGSVVTRNQLFEECWGGAMVGDDSINRAIGRLRKAATEVAPGAFEIETIPRTGYRLITPNIVDPSLRAVTDQGISRDQSIRPRITRRWFVGGGLAAATGGALIWALRPLAPDPAALLIEDSRMAMHSGTTEKDSEAINLLERAVATSPNNADAWGALALARALADEHSIEKSATSLTDVQMAAHRALQLNPSNADAKAARAIAIPYYGDWLAAERRFDSVLEQHPDHLFARDSHSFFLGSVGRIRESAEARLSFASKAPLDPDFEYRHVYALWFLGRIAEADRIAARGLEIWPRHPGVWFARLWLLTGTDRLDRALVHLDDQEARPQLPPMMIKTLRLAIGAAISRNPGEVDAAVDAVLGVVSRSVAGVVNAMMLLNLMEATNPAFALAEAYYLERGPIITAMQWRPGQPLVPDQRRRKTNMLFTPTAAGMQRDPRFFTLVEQMGMADYWRQRNVVPDFLTRGA